LSPTTRFHRPAIWLINSMSTPQRVRSRPIALLLTLRLQTSPVDNYKKWSARKNGRNVSNFSQI
jgi:hypothetical protein